jgi:hypothetical protein
MQIENIKIIRFLKDSGISLRIDDVKDILKVSANTVVLKNRNASYTLNDVYKICKHEHYPFVKALVGLGFIDQEEIDKNSTNKNGNLDTVKSEVLVTELLSRLKQFDEVVEKVWK